MCVGEFIIIRYILRMKRLVEFVSSVKNVLQDSLRQGFDDVFVIKHSILQENEGSSPSEKWLVDRHQNDVELMSIRRILRWFEIFSTIFFAIYLNIKYT